MVHRVWKAAGLKPHLVRTFKLSNDPHFIEKLIDVVGLYLNPAGQRVGAQRRREEPVPSARPHTTRASDEAGRAGTMTHDYKRNGTTTLFAAMELAHGRMISKCMNRHRHQEWIKFLKLIDAQTPPNWTCT